MSDVEFIFQGTGAIGKVGENLAIPDGQFATVIMDGAGATDEIEIQAQPSQDYTPFSIADSKDTIDPLKKVVNSTNNVRTIVGPMKVRLLRFGAGTSNITVWFMVDA